MITIEYIFYEILFLGIGGLILKSYQLIREHYEKKKVAQILDQIQKNQPVFIDQIKPIEEDKRIVSYFG